MAKKIFDFVCTLAVLSFILSSFIYLVITVTEYHSKNHNEQYELKTKFIEDKLVKILAVYPSICDVEMPDGERFRINTEGKIPLVGEYWHVGVHYGSLQYYLVRQKQCR